MRSRCVITFLSLSTLILTPVALPAATGYFVHNLVADTAGVADTTDPNLVNPWGISISATSPFWLCDGGTGLSTVYSYSATAFAVTTTKAVIPPAASGGDTTCTGIVANGSTGFLVGTATPTKASFIFSTVGGAISGWAAAVSATQAQMAIDNSASGAVYYGLAFYNPSSAAPAGSAARLYAPNFFTGKIEVYDTTWKAVTTLGANAFVDPKVPAGYAPFNIQYLGGTAAVEGKMYVTWAKQDSTKKLYVSGAGAGYVSVFDVNGTLISSLIGGGNLNAPWGVALAQSFPTTATGTVANLQFGAFSGDLIVGNFGDGTINAYKSTGVLDGQLQDASGNPIKLPGLWGLQFGNGGSGGDPNTLFFTTGTATLKHGLFGSIQANPVTTTANIQNDGSFSTNIAPNTWVAILGQNLSATARLWKTTDFSGGGSGLPTALDGVSVTINNEPAFVEFVSPKQINVLTPSDLAVGSNINVVVTNNGLTSATVPITVQATAPAFFTTGTKYVVAQHLSYAFLGPTSLGAGFTPAANGETIILYGTGFGPTTPTVVNGQVVSGSPNLVSQPTITVGGVNATVVFAGLVSGSAGLYQFDVTLPTGLASGDQPISASAGGGTTQANLFVTIQ